MKHRVLDTIVLAKDLPRHRLKAGDVGTIVELYGEEAMEVEFVCGSGRPLALLTLQNDLLRDMASNEVLTVRPTN